MKTPTVKFLGEGVDPPARRHNITPEIRTYLNGISNELRKSPGEWAEVEWHQPKSAGDRLRKWLGPQYEVSQRQTGTLRGGQAVFTIYARRRPLETRTVPEA